MQINYMRLTILSLCCVLTSCSANNTEEENFEMIQGDFPRLVDVPDRPSHPAQSDLDQIKDQLIESQQQAEMLKEEIFAANKISKPVSRK